MCFNVLREKNCSFLMRLGKHSYYIKQKQVIRIIIIKMQNRKKKLQQQCGSKEEFKNKLHHVIDMFTSSDCIYINRNRYFLDKSKHLDSISRSSRCHDLCANNQKRYLNYIYSCGENYSPKTFIITKKAVVPQIDMETSCAFFFYK